MAAVGFLSHYLSGPFVTIVTSFLVVFFVCCYSCLFLGVFFFFLCNERVILLLIIQYVSLFAVKIEKL